MGNGTTIAFISKKGSVDWLSAPDGDQPSHFSSLLDERSGGRFSIRPAGPFESNQTYLGRKGRSAVLETRFVTPQGEGRVIDWMPWNRNAVLMRQVESLEGRLSWELFCLPRPDYGLSSARPDAVGNGLCFRYGDGALLGRLAGTHTVRLEPMLGAGVTRFDLEGGEQHRFLWAAGRAGSRTEHLLDQGFDETLREWEAWMHACSSEQSFSDALPPSWQALTIRSEMVLRLLTHAGTGAPMESASTSLPCVQSGTQNWDHRYCWLKHLPGTLEAWLALGHSQESEALSLWLEDLLLAHPAAELASAYRIDGAPIPDEQEMHTLRGHEGARPVRIGNLSSQQFQLDGLAGMLDALALSNQVRRTPPNPRVLRKLEELALLICQLWRRPDHGLWDLRFRPEHYLSSKLACWKGLRSAAQFYRESDRTVPHRWTEEIEKLRQTILREGFHRERQIYTQAFGETELDSSALLVGLWGLEDWSEPSLLSTLIQLESELREGPFLRRSRNSHSSPDFEGGHLLSTLWWCSALARTERADEAAETLSELARLAGPLGILGEGIEVSSGQPVGNLPSLRAHSQWISTSLEVARALEESKRERKAA